jgi:hypothetical protein
MFTSAEFAAGSLEQRMVSCGLRIKNTEAPLNTSGIIEGYNTPSGLGMAGTQAAASYLDEFNTRRMTKHTNLNKWFEIQWDHDDELNAQTWQAGAAYLQKSTPDTVVHIEGNAANPASVVIEMISHWEVRGRTVAYAATPNESDPSSFSKVYSAVSDALRMAGNTAISSPHLRQAAMSYLMGNYGISQGFRTITVD